MKSLQYKTNNSAFKTERISIAGRPTWKVTSQDLHSHPNSSRRPPLRVQPDVLRHRFVKVPELRGVVVRVPLEDLRRIKPLHSGARTWTVHGFYAICPPSLTLGRLERLSMMKIQSFPFRLWAALYFLTNARFSVVAPPAASPPRAPWVMTPRMVLGTPKSTCRCEVETKQHRVVFCCSRPSCLSSSNCYRVHKDQFLVCYVSFCPQTVWCTSADSFGLFRISVPKVGSHIGLWKVKKWRFLRFNC